MTASELAEAFAKRAKARRLDRRLTQQGLAARAGITLGSLKRFEQTGQIAFTSLLKIAVALDAVGGVADLFAEPEFSNLDEVLEQDRPRRKRGTVS